MGGMGWCAAVPSVVVCVCLCLEGWKGVWIVWGGDVEVLRWYEMGGAGHPHGNRSH